MNNGLPPKPDSQTGKPRPPRAPLEPGWKSPEVKHKRGVTKVPQQPEGEGPILEWFFPTRGRALTFGLIMVTIMVAFFTWRDFGFGWVTVWWLWLFIVPWPSLFLLTGRNLRMSAGADWLAYGKNFVKTYELTKVNVTVGGAAHYLDIEDSHGRQLYVQINNLQLNRELWDLAYLGLLYSVHEGGASTNKMARDYLGLNIPPHLRKWESRDA
ncbi:hypothetical protein [Saccharopolyspora spinosa]|uniref:Uncharacterized protein n=1 Tax=Saccharopolyspora spinosa TaxID=60894 RepID=A0A2N3XSP0_SACSN|nr:hypothetical protein [Saccharopolyspora spinosa]PKW13708.1 hypothetical protein A8926_1260 [Saccharopolyspora spinosa]